MQLELLHWCGERWPKCVIHVPKFMIQQKIQLFLTNLSKKTIFGFGKVNCFSVSCNFSGQISYSQNSDGGRIQQI